MKQPFIFRSLIGTLFFILLLSDIHNIHAQMWDLKQKLGSSDQEPADNLGISVAVSDSFMIAGAWWEERPGTPEEGLTSAGAAYLYKLQPNGVWLETQKLESPHREILGYYGFCVAMAGEYAMVGAFNEDHSNAGNAGRVYAYHRNVNGQWILDDSLKLANPGNNDYFGIRVSMTSDYALIGADGHDYDETGANFKDEAGAAFLFKRQPDNRWTKIRTFVALDREAGDHYGKNLDLDERGMVIGASSKDGGIGEFEIGAAYAVSCDIQPCDFDQITKANLKKLQAPDRNSYERFGWDVAISGSWLVVGKSGESDQPGGSNGSNTGAAYFLHWENGNWVGKQKVFAPDFSTGAKFGRTVAMDGPVCVIGAGGESEDVNGQNFVSGAGAAYVFELQNNNQWVSVEKLVGTNRRIGDLFGEDAADVSGTHVVVGAWLADYISTAEIIDGGAVYIFERDSPITAVNENTLSNNLIIKNNPSGDGILHIAGIEGTSFPTSLEVFTMEGVRVFHKDAIYQQDYDADVSILPSGIYFVQIHQLGYQPHTLKWIRL